MKSKLKKLQSELEVLKKKEYNARQIRDHHSREMRKAVEADDLRDYEMHNAKHQFHNKKFEILKVEIQVIKKQMKAETFRIKEESYQESLRTFDLTMAEKLLLLQEALMALVKDLELKDIIRLGDNAYDFFVANSKSFKREDLIPFNMFGLLRMKVVLDHIVEEYGEMGRVTTTRGSSAAAQKRSNVQVWSTNLVGQIQSCLDVIQERSKPSKLSTSFKEKVKGLLLLL